MKRGIVVFLPVCMVMLGVCVSLGYAQDEAAPKGVSVTVTGVNYCLLDALAKDKAGDANPNYAVLNALRVQEALGADGAIEDLVGKTLHYVPTKESEPLLVGQENQGLSFTVRGLWFKDACALLVESYEEEVPTNWVEQRFGSKSGEPDP